MIGAVAVVIPVHDEEELLADCLRSVVTAARRARAHGVETSVHVVLDACTDASARIAAGFPVGIHVTDARRVGFARQAGVDAALARHGGIARDRLWIAHTDGDSAVPANWLVDQLDRAAEGADVYVGTVRPRMRDLGARHREAWVRTHPPGPPNGHVHGANLGTRASTLVQSGGFADVVEHEDVEVVASARAAGARVVASGDACVVTSGRLVGRTPGGYASYLRDQLLPLAGSPVAPEDRMPDRLEEPA